MQNYSLSKGDSIARSLKWGLHRNEDTSEQTNSDTFALCRQVVLFGRFENHRRYEEDTFSALKLCPL